MEKNMEMTGTLELKIDEKARNYAKIYASLIDNEFQRKRSYASITGLYAFSNLIAETNYSVQKAMTIFRNPDLNEKYEISDIYINNWHIDIRIITDGDAFIVPRIHEEYSIEPDFYAVIQMDSSLQSAKLVGFAKPDEMKKEPLDYHYYSVLTSELFDYNKFLNLVKDKKPLNFNDEEHKFFLDNYLSLIDKEADETSTKRILKHLFQCPECRAEFCCFTGFEMVNCNLCKYPEILEDQTLNIIGAQAVESEKYDGKEETVYFNNKHADTQDNQQEKDQPDETEKEDLVEATEQDAETEINNESSVETEDSPVHDILDELFSPEEEENVSLINDVEITEEVNTDNQDLNLLEEDTKNIEDEKDTDIITEPDFIEINDDNEEQIELLSNDEEIIEEFQEIDDSTDLLEIGDEEDISLIDDTEEAEPELDILEEQNDNKTESESVDKVIVDYDEQGEPIYSYITNINGETESDIETIDENTDDETMQTLDIIDDEEENKDENNVEADLAENDENQDFDDDFDDIDNTKTDINEKADDISSDEEEYEEEADNGDFDEFDTDEEESENQTEQENNDDEDEEYEYDEEDNGEYDEDEDDENTTKKSSKKPLMIAGAVTIAVIAIAVATFGLIKQATNDTKIANNAQETSVPTQIETNKIFNDIDENDIFNTLENNASDTNLPEQTNNGEDMGLEIPDAQNEQPNVNAEANTAETAVSENNGNNGGTKELTEKDLITPQPSNDLNKVMAGAFSNQSQLVTSIKGINWQCMPALFSNQDFKTYLQKLDKALKVNINSNLLNSTTAPVNNTISYKLAIDNQGNLLKIQAGGSTGSDEIDNIVLQSIKETLALQKTQIINNGEQKADKYLLQVVIKL